MFAALWIGAVILVSNFGYGWYTDTVSVHTQYKAFTTEEIRADVGLHIGLRGINITLKGNDILVIVSRTDSDWSFRSLQANLWIPMETLPGRPLITTNNSTGLIPGPRVVLGSDALPAVSTRSSEQPSSVECPILYCGLLSTSH